MYKLSCLAVFPQIPLPLVGAMRHKVHNQIQILAKNYILDVVIITNEPPNQASHDFLAKICRSYKILTISKITSYLNVMKGIFNNYPMQANYYCSSSAQTYINEKMLNVDFCFGHLVRSAKYIEKFKGIKFLDMVDTISLNYKRTQKSSESLLWRAIASIEYKKLSNFEKRCFTIFDKVFLVNQVEVKMWEGQAISNVVWTSNGTKEGLLSYNKVNTKYTGSVVFIGKMDYQPNTDAMLWYINNVHQHVCENIKLVIVGLNPPQSIIKQVNKYKNIEVTGFVEDPYEIMNAAMAIISPMQTGAGIQNKVLEGMALGKINIVSSLASIGIAGAINGEHFIIEDEPLKIATLLNGLPEKNKTYLTSMSEKSKKLIEKYYTWAFYEDAIIKGINNSIIHLPKKSIAQNGNVKNSTKMLHVEKLYYQNNKTKK